MSKIAREVAEADVTAWLDKKKIFQETREKYQENYIDTLIEAVMEGVLTLDGPGHKLDDAGAVITDSATDSNYTYQWTHTLQFPLKGEQPVEKLTYKARLNDKMLQPYLKGVDSKDADGRLLAHVAALTATPRGILVNLDSIDKKVALAIAIFFL